MKKYTRKVVKKYTGKAKTIVVKKYMLRLRLLYYEIKLSCTFTKSKFCNSTP